MTAPPCSRRAFLRATGALALTGSVATRARAGEATGTAFEARGLRLAGSGESVDPTALATVARELERRTSAAAVKEPAIVTLGASAALASPLLFAAGSSAVEPLDARAQSQLRAFFSLGGLLVVDDRDGGTTPSGGPFSRALLRELAAVLPESSTIDLTDDHVLFRSFYLLRRVVGAKGSSGSVRALARGNRIDAIVLRHDLTSALATRGSRWMLAMDDDEREQAVRFAVNLAMYSLCSTYKDDQVHAPFLMRRRAGAPRGR
jgi:hypothetical protein